MWKHIERDFKLCVVPITNKYFKITGPVLKDVQNCAFLGFHIEFIPQHLDDDVPTP